MLVAAIPVTPIGLLVPCPRSGHPQLLLAGSRRRVLIGHPVRHDQLAMARMDPATFALMLALLPVSANGHRRDRAPPVPHGAGCRGIALVTTGVAIHQELK